MEYMMDCNLQIQRYRMTKNKQIKVQKHAEDFISQQYNYNSKLRNTRMPRLGNQLLLICALCILLQVCDSQPTGSDNCQSYNNNLSVCQVCQPGFYLQFWFCVPCKPRCLCYNKDDFCSSCMQTEINGLNHISYYDSSTEQCQLCSAQMSNCLDCSKAGFCTQCFNGRYIIKEKDLDGTVTSQYCSSTVCADNCQICMTNNQCKTCSDGYFLLSNNKCTNSICQNNCQVCQSETLCKTCQSGYFLQTLPNTSKICTPCMLNCSECSSSTTCSTCEPSFNFQNGSCSNNGLSNCVTYAADFTVCLGCEDGYQVTAGSCNPCAGCDLCKEQFICTSQCQTGFLPFNYACIPSFQDLLNLKWFFLIFLMISIFY